MSLNPSPCSAGIEKPCRPDVRRASHDLHQVVDALHVDARLRFGSLDHLPEGVVVADQRALEDSGDLEPLRHDVEGDGSARIGLGQHALHFRQIFGLQNPGFVGQHVQTAVNRCRDAIDLAAIAPGQHDDVARVFAEHALEEIGRSRESPSARPSGARHGG